LWKLEGTQLTNLWKPNANWRLKPNGNSFYVENILEKRVLGIKDGNTRTEVAQNTAKQSWKKGEVNDEGYFILTNLSSKQILTANSSDDFEIKDLPLWQKGAKCPEEGFFTLTYRDSKKDSPKKVLTAAYGDSHELKGIGIIL
jgi:hypothetical protein